MRLLLVSVLTLISFNAFADSASLKREIVDTLQDIRSEVGLGLASDQTLTSTLNQLKDTLAYLQGGTEPQPSVQLTCTSRDNDGHNPFIIARRNSDFSITRINGTVMKQADCTATLKNVIEGSLHQFVCATKDNDGNSPFIAAAIPLTGDTAIKFGVFRRLSDCTDSLTKAKTNTQFLALCASRDNDGNSPFTRFVFNSAKSEITTTGEEFRSIAECWAAAN